MGLCMGCCGCLEGSFLDVCLAGFISACMCPFKCRLLGEPFSDHRGYSRGLSDPTNVSQSCFVFFIVFKVFWVIMSMICLQLDCWSSLSRKCQRNRNPVGLSLLCGESAPGTAPCPLCRHLKAWVIPHFPSQHIKCLNPLCFCFYFGFSLTMVPGLISCPLESF